jgi:hypothetical protein
MVDENSACFNLACRSGRVGSTPEGKPASARRLTFSEQDQTDLYNRVQSGKSQGRVGLGTNSQPKKIGGARWQGTKTWLGDRESEGMEDSEQVRTRTLLWHCLY